jgi:hypothetical protein
MAGRHGGSRHGSLDRLHPLIELALLEYHLAQARTRLEYLLLAGGLKILRDRHLERGFVLRHKAAHAVELFNPSSMAPRHAGCEVAFLSVEQILEQIHGADPHGGLPSSCTAPRHRSDPRPSPVHEQFHDRMEPFVGIDAAGFHDHYIQRRIGFCREWRPAARAMSARNMEAAGTDIVGDGGFSFDLDCRASDDDGREGAARLRPAAVAMAKTGYDRRRRDPVTDGPTCIHRCPGISGRSSVISRTSPSSGWRSSARITRAHQTSASDVSTCRPKA